MLKLKLIIDWNRGFSQLNEQWIMNGFVLFYKMKQLYGWINIGQLNYILKCVPCFQYICLAYTNYISSFTRNLIKLKIHKFSFTWSTHKIRNIIKVCNTSEFPIIHNTQTHDMIPSNTNINKSLGVKERKEKIKL